MMQRMSTVPAALLVVIATTSVAGADGVKLSAEVPAAVPVGQPQNHRFGFGTMPAIGVFVSPIAGLDTGVRGRGGALTDGEEMDPTLRDPGLGGVASGLLAVRAHPGTWLGLPGLGGWVEVAGGVAVTGRELRPSYEVALGWRFEVGRFSAGPAARYLFIRGVDDSLDSRGAHLALVGLDIGFAAPRAVTPVILPDPPEPEPEPLAAPAPPRLEVAYDGDRLVDSDRPCPLAVPHDEDGCSLPDDMVVEGDRIVLDERILFDNNRARVKRRGKKVLRVIADAWQANRRWHSIRIEGHADRRGPEDYNQELSELRAERVRAVLVELGVPPEVLTSYGFGSRKPRVDSRSEGALERNRRVEFVIVSASEARVSP